MMKKIAMILFLGMVQQFTFAAKDESGTAYSYTVDLVNVQNDKVNVTLIPPRSISGEAIFRLPAFVPGTYEIYNFGRFISNFKALDKSGTALPIEKIDENSWKISQMNQVDKIVYEVNDTWDSEIKEDFVFEPGGSNIEAGKNFVLNNHCFFGYFDSYKNNIYNIEVLKPKGFYGSSALIASSNTVDKETYVVNNFVELVDSPIMFCIPDTTTLTVGNAKVLVSVYSSKYKNSAGPVAKNIESVLTAQKDFLGGKLPIEKYAFIIYLFPGYSISNAYGALEHNNTSLYFLPEQKPEELGAELKTFAAHEFFHIITPLTVHSEEIGNFEFNNPKMSRHLWMYEGVTEYFAGSVQVKYGLISQNEYLNVLHDKMDNADMYKDTLPFTKMSLSCLDANKDQYSNVYEKGALIGLCLDVKLLELSNGKYNLQNLMSDLSKKYGKSRSFKDEELFDEIARITYPGVREFISKYIEGPNHLPISETLDSVGINYIENGLRSEISPLGGIIPAYNKTNGSLYISNSSYRNINEFGKSIGFNIGDQLLKLNGKTLTDKNMEQVLTDYMYTAKEGKYLKLVVLRKDDKGVERKVKLKTKIVPTMMEAKHLLAFSPTASPRQLYLRKLLLEK